ncbi:putative lupus La protein [Rosa chinensis]|uniref:Putative lupus La protein n=1 Tax=Rosa chinensis TaxID=74649 RepID=A0A2P6Q5I4_ROSCH|nr:la-related protein 6A [Rosa chinensis]PRQ29445.1 putative lupus La protein [Rosa chinensis]
MEGEEGPADAAIVAVAVTTADSTAPSPPNDSDVSPVGSPDHGASSEILRLPSDDDPDQSAGGALTEDLKQKIIKQVEYYFSDENLPNDKYMLSLIKKNKEGFVPISVIASFRKMKKLIQNNSLIVAALKDSSLLVVSSNGKKVKRLHPLPLPETRDPKFTVLVENLPTDHSVENLKKMFSEAGNIKDICILDPSAIEASAKGGKVEKPISNKLHALVEYDTVEATEKAVAILNNEEDWRNGMRVKLLKQMGKYGQSGQRRQSRRGFDSEKSSSSRTSETGIEETHNANEHHNGTPDEEDGGDQVPKEKTGHRGRSRGQSGRQKYRGLNGFGHGTTSSSHPIEPSKPPPGPRMPDGTRGFTMGRGRTPVPNQS